MENNLLANYGVSAHEEKLRWQNHRLEQMLAWANLSFEAKVQSLEEMEALAQAFSNPHSPKNGRSVVKG